MPTFRKTYVAETEADTFEEAQENFGDDGAEYGPTVKPAEEFSGVRNDQVTLPDWLRAEVKDALEGDSNDAEHDALAAVADAFGIKWTSPYARRFALLSNQGTACAETVLDEDDYLDPAKRAAVEKAIVPGPDAPIPGTWTDCTDNDAL